MKVIYKFPLAITDEQFVPLFESQQILTAAFQDGMLFLWALVDPDSPTAHTKIHIVGTGRPLPFAIEDAYWFATVQQGPFVWHIFQEHTI